MDDPRTQKESPLLNWFFVVVGALFIVSSFVIRALRFEAAWAEISVDVLLNVGASLIATAGVAYLYQQFGTNSLSAYLDQLLKNFSITQRAMDLGIKDMWKERRHIPNDMWNTFTEAAKMEVCLLGMAELGFAEDPKFRKIVIDGARRGCNYRFLLLDPESEAVNEVDLREGGGEQLQGRIRRSLRGFAAMREQAKGAKGKIQIRVHCDAPQVSVVRSDNELLVTPYMYGLPGNSSFTLRIHQISGGIFDYYIKFFEEVWEKAHSPSLELINDSTEKRSLSTKDTKYTKVSI